MLVLLLVILVTVGMDRDVCGFRQRRSLVLGVLMVGWLTRGGAGKQTGKPRLGTS